MSKSDYYSTLGLSRDATQDDIKKAYRKLAMQYHPDRNKGDAKAEAKFKEVTEAYEVLKDEQKKAGYDRYGHNAYTNQGQGGSSGGFHSSSNFDDFGDIFSAFSDMMGGGRSGQRSRAKVRGDDLSYTLNISLEEAFAGIEKQISFSTLVSCKTCSGKGSKDGSSATCNYCKGRGIIRSSQGFFTVEQECPECNGDGHKVKNPCSVCSGSGRSKEKVTKNISIPAGIQNEQRIKYSGDGEAGVRGGNAGDLYVLVNVLPNKFFKVDGVDLHCKIPISYTLAVLGGEIEVPGIDGVNIKVMVPAHTQNDTKLKLKSKGMSRMRSEVRGDMFIHVYIDVPKKLTKKQRDLIEELDKELKNNAEESLFDKVKNLWSSK